MIKRVYETYTFNELTNVKKTIKEKSLVKRTRPVKEKIQIAPESWVCGRCGRKLNGPKCPHCVCSVCGRSLMNRPKHHYKCGYCWGMGSLGFTYHHEVKHIDAKYEEKIVEKTVEEWGFVEKEIEVKEFVSKEGKRIVSPLIIDYSYDNKIIKEYIKFTHDKKNKSGHFNFSYKNTNINKEIEKDSYWYGASSYEDALNKISDNTIEIEEPPVFNFINIPFEEYIIDEKQILEEFDDVVGFYPNVPAYIQGHPLNMYNNKRVNVVTLDKIVNVYFNLALDSNNSPLEYKNRGLLVYYLILNLINQGYKVNLKLFDITYINDETLVLEFSPVTLDKNDSNNNKLNKQENTPDYLYKILVEVSFYRIILYNEKLNILNNYTDVKLWERGFGFPVQIDDFKKIVRAHKKSIIITNPEELSIAGFDIDDDLNEGLITLKITNHTDNGNIMSNLSEDNSEEVVSKRNIEKLIHVTSTRNIKSILDNGVIPKSTLLEMGVDFHQNDFQRLDNHIDSICLSVTEPNRRLFNDYVKRNPDTDYIILEISPKILFPLEEGNGPKKIFYDYNAASKHSMRSKNDMNIMFKEEIIRRNIKHNREGKNKNQTTSEQAEILFFGKIPSEYILGMYEYDTYKKYAPIQNKHNDKSDLKTISEIVKENDGPSAQAMNILLSEFGYLTKEDNKYVPTKLGEVIGISIEKNISQKGFEYETIKYDNEAQKAVIDIIKGVYNEKATKNN